MPVENKLFRSKRPWPACNIMKNFMWNRHTWNRIKMILATKIVLQLLQNLLVELKMSENIHDAKLLQPVTAYDEG